MDENQKTARSNLRVSWGIAILDGPPTFALHVLIKVTLIVLVAGCGSPQYHQSVPGPEATDLVPRLTGCLVFTGNRGQLVAMSLPDKRMRVVRPAAGDDVDYFPVIHAVSGPDDTGRVAYIEDYFFVENEKDQKHLLKTIGVDGKNDAVVFSRAGSAMWATSAAGNGEIGSQLALAPTGGKVAFLSGLADKQMPGVLLSQGDIEVWDVENKRALEVRAQAVDEPMSWFPDGRRLAYVKMMPIDDLPKRASLREFADYFNGWDEVPAVHILDTDTGRTTFLHVGWTPVVSEDGKKVLIGGWTNKTEFVWKSVNPATGESESVEWPGDVGRALAVSANNLVVYWGWPTKGEPIQHTQNNSPLVGPKPMLTLKVARTDSDKFQTILPAIDPRERVSFGFFSSE